MEEDNNESVLNPKAIWEEAQNAEAPEIKHSLSDYYETIYCLRGKGWSYRQIATWLTEHGIKANFNQVYYVTRTPREVYRKMEEEDALTEDAFENDAVIFTEGNHAKE